MGIKWSWALSFILFLLSIKCEKESAENVYPNDEFTLTYNKNELIRVDTLENPWRVYFLEAFKGLWQSHVWEGWCVDGQG